MPSAKSNAFLNAAYQVIRLIFPIITYPYVSRVLGPAGLGKVAYAQKIADYFCQTSLLGIPAYGLREVSKARTSEQELSRAFSELFLLTVATSMVALLVYVGLPFVFPGFVADPKLHWVFALMVLVNPGKLDWFYQGMEQYKYVTARSLVIRVATAVLTFVVIQQADDYVWYGALWVAGTVATALLNFGYSRKFVQFSRYLVEPMRHLARLLPSMGIQLVATLSSALDVVMLGALLNDDQVSVGYYSVALRIPRIVFSIVVAGLTVVLPKVSLSHAEGNKEQVDALVSKSFSYMLFFTLPMVVGLFVMAEEIILLFAGGSFAPAVTTLRILAPQVLVFAMGNIVNMQVFYAQGREKSVFVISLISVLLILLLNWLLIPRYMHNGAAATTISVTSLGLLIQSSLEGKKIARLLFTRVNGSILLVLLAWVGVLIGAHRLALEWSLLARTVWTVGFGAVAYTILSLLFRLYPAIDLLRWMRGKLRRSR